MNRYITASVVVETFVEERRSLFVQGERLALLLEQLTACDRETTTLESEKRHIEAENRSLRLRIQQLNDEIRRLRMTRV
jgi:hypothetical protein